MTWLLSGFSIGRSPTEASQIKVLVPVGLAPGVSILYVKLCMPFSCTDAEFQRRPGRPGLHRHYGEGNFCFVGKGVESHWLAMFCCLLPEGGATGAASLRKPESEKAPKDRPGAGRGVSGRGGRL